MSSQQAEIGEIVSARAGRRRWLAWLPLGLSLLWVIWTLAQVQPVLRESDQASLLHGALQLATEKSWQLDGYALGDESGRPFYRVGTYWGSYLLNGLWLGLLEGLGLLDLQNLDAQALLFWSNGLAAAVLCLGVLALGLSLCRGAEALQVVALLGFLLSPCILLSASLASPNAVSVGLLLLLLAACVRKPDERWAWVKGLLAFLAVACRADALLVLPILCWIQVEQMSWRGVLGRRDFWAMGLGAVLALGLGLYLNWGNYGGLFPPLFLKLEAISAFLVFGLGASLLLLLASLWRLLHLKRRKAWVRLVAVLLLLLPLGFYALQLYSPRHLMVVAVSALIPLLLSESPKQALERKKSSRRGAILPALAQAILLLAALGPLFAGLRLPELKKPQLSWTSATRYPTTDGLWPMGSLLAFQLELRGGEIDHHAQIWADALVLGEEVAAGQELYFDKTNQLEVYALVGKMQGWRARILSAEEALSASRPVLFERGDLQINKNWYAREENPHQQLPAWDSGRWQRGVGEGLLQLLPAGQSAQEQRQPDWLPITLRPLFAKARLTQIEAQESAEQAEPESWRFALPEHLAGASLVVALEDGRAWKLGLVGEQNAGVVDLQAATQVYAGNAAKVEFTELSWSQQGFELELSWRQQPQARASKPRVFVRQFADYMRY